MARSVSSDSPSASVSTNAAASQCLARCSARCRTDGFAARSILSAHVETLYLQSAATLDRGHSKAMHVELFGSARPIAARTCERLGSWLPARAVLCAHGIAEHCAGARRTERCHCARTTSSIDFASVTRPVDVRHAGILSRRLHAGTRVKRRAGSPRAHRYEFTRSDAWWICRSSIANHRTSLSLSRLALCTGLRAHVVLRGPPPM